MLDEAGAGAVKLMLSKADDHDITVFYEMVGRTGRIGDLAAETMKKRIIDL